LSLVADYGHVAVGEPLLDRGADPNIMANMSDIQVISTCDANLN
jgi:hypothetical protein